MHGGQGERDTVLPAPLFPVPGKATASGAPIQGDVEGTGYSMSSTTSMPFTQAIPVTGTKVRTILPWAVG